MQSSGVLTRKREGVWENEYLKSKSQGQEIFVQTHWQSDM